MKKRNGPTAKNPQLLMKSASDLFADDDTLTDKAVQALALYAQQWAFGERDLDTERQFPELSDQFYDVRTDDEFMHRWLPEEVTP